MTSKIVCGAVGFRRGAAHNLGMARKTKKPSKAKRSPTQIKAWRKHRDMSLEKLSERLMIELEFEISPGQLSRIERGEQPYSQDLLEALSVVLRSSPPALLNVDPGREDGIMSIWDTLSPPQRVQLVEIGKTLKRTGTDG
jgi:transcriptional regulator with XRE-family HTH domain